MLDNLLAWMADWRHPAVIVAAVVLLYLARDGAQRLLRTAFLFAAHGLRLEAERRQEVHGEAGEEGIEQAADEAHVVVEG